MHFRTLVASVSISPASSADKQPQVAGGQAMEASASACDQIAAAASPQQPRALPWAHLRGLWRLGLLLLLAVCLQGMSHSLWAYERVESPPADEAVETLIPAELIVKFRPGVGRQRRLAALNRVARRVRHFADRNRGPGGQRGPRLFEQLTHIDLQLGVAAEEAIAALEQNPDVVYAEPNHAVRALQNLPNDPDLHLLWGLSNSGQTGGAAGADIDAPTAWDITTGSDQVVVAVIDTGVDYNHADLAGNMWVNAGEIANNGVDDDGNGMVDDVYGYDFFNNDGDPKDDHFHGTHCAGTIGAVGNDGSGVAGVNWTVRLMAVKFLGASGSGNTAGAISAIQYAMNNGAQVMSNSWGGSGYSQALQDVILAAYDAGITFVAAAGNNGNDNLVYPAAYDRVIAVSATDHNDVKAGFSSFGAFVDIAAPGVSIYSTTLNGSYGYASGTSMATPHVSGVAALLKAQDPSLTPEQVEYLLETSADDLGNAGWDTWYGAGRLQAAQALQSAQQGNTSFPTVRLTAPTHGQIAASAPLNIVGAASGSDFASYTVAYASVGSNTWTEIASSTTPVADGVLAAWDTNMLADGDYLLLLTVTDTLGRQLHEAVTVIVDNYDTEITFPTQLVSLGSIDVLGSAATINSMPFDSYVLEWGVGSAPTSFSSAGITLVNGGQQPVANGILGAWDTSNLSDGQTYTLRLTVHSGLGGQSQSAVQVRADADLVTGWPIVLSTSSTRHVVPTIADLDGDGSQEVIVAGPDEQIRVYRKDASAFPGFPVALNPGDAFRWAVNVTDLDGDGTQEIIAVVKNASASPRSSILILEHDGAFYSGWPNPGLGASQDSWDLTPSVADLNGDGNKDLVTIEVFTWVTHTDVTLHAYDLNGVELPGFPKLMQLPAIGFGANDLYPSKHGVASIADLDQDGFPEIAWSFSNRIYLFDHQGNIMPGWPFIAPSYNGKTMLFENAAASGDIDGDGQLELFAIGRGHNCGYCETQLYGWRQDGSVLPGWPRTDQTDGIRLTNVSSTQHTPALIDLNADGADEVVVGLATLTVFNANGLVPFPSSPIASDTQPSASDVDGDGLLEFSGNRSSTISIADDDGSAYWSRFMPGGGKRNTLGLFGDLDRDNTMELVLIHADNTPSIALYVWEIPRPTASPAAEEWRRFSYDAARSGRQVLSQTGPPQDSTPPVSAIDAPTHGGAVTGVVTVLMSASDNVGVTRVELSVDGVLFGVDATAPYSLSWDTTATSNGDHTLEARAYDAAGNVGPSTPVTVSVNNDTTPPSTPALASPTNGSATNDSTPTFDWSNVSDPSGVVYHLQVDNDVSFSSPDIDLSALGVSTYTPSQALSDGAYAWRVRAIDSVGNTSDWSGVWMLTIDTQPPNAINAPSNLAADLVGNTVTLTWEDNAVNEEGFSIEQGQKEKGSVVYTEIGVVGANIPVYSAPVSSGTTWYRVRAFNQTTGTVSGYSNEVSVKVTGRNR